MRARPPIQADDRVTTPSGKAGTVVGITILDGMAVAKVRLDQNNYVTNYFTVDLDLA